MTSHERFLAEIERFMERHKMPPTVFGRLASNDFHLIKQLRANKRGISLPRVDRIRAFMAAYDKEHPVTKPRRRSKSNSHVAA